jgi:tryptophan synthase alpha chain
MPQASDVFTAAAEQGRMTFMPFITAGDPDLATTAQVLRGMAESGVDLIELGFPYSDPIADGAVIQASYTRSLEAGVTVDGIFTMLNDLPTDDMPPIFAMVSFAMVFRFGAENFLTRATESGFSGLIIPDLPAEEAEDFSTQAQQHQLDLVQLIAPTTIPERTATILNAAHGFVYCISVAGTTGVRNELPPELSTQLRGLRQQTKLPLAVGFGISSPDQVATLEGVADGVIVGSAIVRLIADADSAADAVTAVKEFSAAMNAAVAAVAPSTHC